MAVFRNPILRHTFLPVNRNAGDVGADIIVSNTSTRVIRNLPLPSQLTQFNGTNAFTPRTRESAFKDITIVNPRVVGRLEQSRTKYQKNRYFDPRI